LGAHSGNRHEPKSPVPLILRVVVPFNEFGSGAAKGGLAAPGNASAGEDDLPRHIGLFLYFESFIAPSCRPGLARARCVEAASPKALNRAIQQRLERAA
jgi:hypothetical protein